MQSEKNVVSHIVHMLEKQDNVLKNNSKFTHIDQSSQNSNMIE